jgi:hypothetical protein
MESFRRFAADSRSLRLDNQPRLGLFGLGAARCFFLTRRLRVPFADRRRFSWIPWGCVTSAGRHAALCAILDGMPRPSRTHNAQVHGVN